MTEWPLDAWIVAPIMLPALAAAAAVLAFRLRRVQLLIGSLACLLQLGASLHLLLHIVSNGPVVEQAGQWPAPFGITLYADTLSALLLVTMSVVGLACMWNASSSRHMTERAFGLVPLILLLLTALSAALLTHDIFNLYVWFEVMLAASFALMSLGREPKQIDAALRYVMLNLAATTLLLVGVGTLYGLTGTLNFADLAQAIPEVDEPGAVAVAGTMLYLALAAKAALFPLFVWLPASYHAVPEPIAALFAGLLTKIALYALIRIDALVLPAEIIAAQPLLLAIAAFTILFGGIASVVERDLRRVMSFQLVSHVGYVALALSFPGHAAAAAAILYLVYDMIAKTALFLISGLMTDVFGTSDMARMGGLQQTVPSLAAMFLIVGLALAGIPPLAGFWAKLAVLQAVSGPYAVAGMAVALVGAMLTLYAVGRVWILVAWRPAVPLVERAPGWRMRALPSMALTAILIVAGLFPAPLLDLTDRAASELLMPSPVPLAEEAEP